MEIAEDKKWEIESRKLLLETAKTASKYGGAVLGYGSVALGFSALCLGAGAVAEIVAGPIILSPTVDPSYMVAGTSALIVTTAAFNYASNLSLKATNYLKEKIIKADSELKSLSELDYSKEPASRDPNRSKMKEAYSDCVSVVENIAVNNKDIDIDSAPEEKNNADYVNRLKDRVSSKESKFDDPGLSY